MAWSVGISIAYSVARVGRVPPVVYTLHTWHIHDNNCLEWPYERESSTSAVIASKTVQYFLCLSLSRINMQ